MQDSIIIAVLLLSLGAPPVLGQGLDPKIQPGDTVMVLEEGAKLKVGDEILAELRKNVRITVTHVDDPWIGGNVVVDGKPRWGWVQKGAVAPAVAVENAARQPWTYQARFSGDERWSDVLTLPPGQSHVYLARTRLVVRFHKESRGMTTVINPGERFRYQQGELVNCRPGKNAGLKLRRLAVLAVADETYREKFADWKDRIAEITATASHYYEDAVAIRLELVDCRPWNYRAAMRGDVGKTADKLLRIESADAELVIGWLGVIQSLPGEPSNRYELGWYATFGRHICIVDDERRQVPGATLLLLRTLAHTFGAFCVLDKTSMMRLALGAVPIDFQFGETVRQVILLSREFDFRLGVESLKADSARRIQELYRQYHHPNDPLGDDPITKGYRTRRLYQRIEGKASFRFI
jgi:hypothetical protein